MPILVMKDSKTKMVCAWTVPRKGIDAYAIVMLRKMTERLGHKRIVMRSDNEPAILALKEAVRRETDVDVILEEVPVGDHQANGIVENAVKQVRWQFRVLKGTLDTRYNERIGEEHCAVPWLVIHAGSVISRMRKDDEGFTAHRK